MVLQRQERDDATYEDVLALPEHVVGEVVDGELVVSPRPGGRHAGSATKLVGHVASFNRPGPGGDEPGGWIILFEPELHLGKHVMVPDLAGWRRERELDFDRPWFEAAPDWVCEVLSPATFRADRLLKLPKYHAAGVSWAWLVHPVDQTIEVFRAEGASWVLAATAVGDEPARLPPFDLVELPVADLWRF